MTDQHEERAMTWIERLAWITALLIMMFAWSLSQRDGCTTESLST